MWPERSPPICSPLTLTRHLEVEEPVLVAVHVELVGGDHPGADRGGEVLALGRAELELHLAALDVAGGPVVHHAVAADHLPRPLGGQVAAVAADDRRDLELEVEPLGVRRHRDVVVRSGHRVRRHEEEDRRVVPLAGRARVAVAALHPVDVRLEGEEVAHRHRVDRRQQHHLVEGQPVSRGRHVGPRLPPLGSLGEQLDQVRAGVERVHPQVVPVTQHEPDDPQVRLVGVTSEDGETHRVSRSSRRTRARGWRARGSPARARTP